MSDAFQPITINRMKLANRFVRSATYEGLADDDGRVTDALVELYAELAEGEIGLTVVGYAYVQPNGKGAPGMLGIWSDDHTKGFARLAEAAHTRGLNIGLKNNEDQAEDLVEDYDWALTESCFVDEWCQELIPFIEAGKPVFSIEYTDEIGFSDFHNLLCPLAADLNFYLMHKNRNLDEYQATCAETE